jgi:hypothetical protein
MSDLKLEKGVVVLCRWDGADPFGDDTLAILKNHLGQVLEVSGEISRISLRGQRKENGKLVNDERTCAAEMALPVWLPPPGKRWPNFAATFRLCWKEILAGALQVLCEKHGALTIMQGEASRAQALS